MRIRNRLRISSQRPRDHLAIEGAADLIGLLENIQTVMFQFQSQRYAPLALHEAKRCFYMFLQDWHLTCQQYHETFKNNIDMIEYCGGGVNNDTGLVDSELASSGLTHAMATPGQIEDAQDAARERECWLVPSSLVVIEPGTECCWKTITHRARITICPPYNKHTPSWYTGSRIRGKWFV
jgi:hypothetical protein